MNILLFNKDELTESNRLTLSDYRFKHLQKITKVECGGSVKVGEIDGKMGLAKVLQINEKQVELEVNLDRDPPKPLPLTLLLSLPRPKTLKKVIPAAVSMGVKKITLMNSYRVEKSYWQSPVVQNDYLSDLARLGLEQGFDTVTPTICKEKRFKPFVEDRLVNIINKKVALVPHVGNSNTISKATTNKDYVIAIGPEGGFIPYEIDMLRSIGFKPVTLGKRILRVENATVATIAKLF